MKRIAIRPFLVRATWMRVLIPLIVLTLYFISFSWFLSWLLPGYDTNVNAEFVNSAWKLSLLASGLYLVLLVLFKLYVTFKLERYFFALAPQKRRSLSKREKGSEPAFKNSIEKFDFILVLLPLTPVVQYILNNQDILSLLGSLYVVAVFAAFSVLFIIVIPTLLGVVGSTKTLVILGMAFTFTITNMAILSAEFHWLQEGSLGIQLMLLGMVFLVGWGLYNRIGRKFLYSLVAIFFVVISVSAAIQGGPEYGAKTVYDRTDGENDLVELVGSRSPLSTPNIYLLVYDAYVINETMLEYGIDNGAQEEYLETLGFKVYPHTYSISSSTIPTMSRLFNASTEFYGGPRRGISGDGVVQNLLRSFGYKTYCLSFTSLPFWGIGSSYDFSFPTAPSPAGASSAHELLMKSIFMGEFRFDVDFEPQLRNHFIQLRLGVFADVPDEPRFVYMHEADPNHSPLTGVCRPEQVSIYERRLGRANNQMKQDVEEIINSDPGGIIVVAGDHGPYLTKNCTPDLTDYSASEISRLDVQDRFGTFLAIKWPTEDFSEYDDITVLQDLFPAIFAYLFKDDAILEAKVDSTTLTYGTMSGVTVEDGIIHGGINDGEPLFLDQR